MKLEAKVKNCNTEKPCDRVVIVDADYVSADVDEVRAYIIDELEVLMPGKVNYEFIVTNMDDLLKDLTPPEKNVEE